MTYKLESTATEQADQENGGQFPMLMINVESNSVFLIIGICNTGYIGTRIITDGTCGRRLGQHSDGWTRELMPYYGTVTLKGSEV